MSTRVRMFAGVTTLMLSGSAIAYPGGTPSFVTDVAPYCASCHSSVSAAQLDGVPEKRVQAELVGSKHIGKIKAAGPGSPYASLSEVQRAALVQGIEAIDAASRIEITAPLQVKGGDLFDVTVTAVGGSGPVVGIALVDAAHRWQARPAASAGWQVADVPRVLGPDGAVQSKFTSKRLPGLLGGISYVNVYGIDADPLAGEFDTVQVTYRLRAPRDPGTYPLGAVFLYGTEKAAPNGAVKEVWGQRPIGGFTGNSGRVRFSNVLAIKVD